MSTRREFVAGALGAALAGRPELLRADADAPRAARCGTQPVECGVCELRQYTLRGGRRDTLVAVFERYFIESQEAVGAHVIGTFLDLDDADRFVWIRGFRDMPARTRALDAFYGGPVWQAHRTAANATMVDSDNVLLLRPIAPAPFAARAATAGEPGGLLGATIHYLGGVDAAEFGRFHVRAILPLLTAAGGEPIARLVSEESPNEFPRLPVRENERVHVCFTRWPGVAAANAFHARFSALSGWRDGAPEAVLPALMRKPERLLLQATGRSALR